MASSSEQERFQAKWIPVRVKKTRQKQKIEPRSDSIGSGLDGNMTPNIIF